MEKLLKQIETKNKKMDEVYYEIKYLENKLSKLYDEYDNLKNEKIKFNGEIKFTDNIFLPMSEGGFEKFDTKDKIFNIKNGYVTLKGIKVVDRQEYNIERTFFWEQINDIIQILKVED